MIKNIDESHRTEIAMQRQKETFVNDRSISTAAELIAKNANKRSKKLNKLPNEQKKAQTHSHTPTKHKNLIYGY